MIPALINKTDTFEAVRNKIAQILANESASQVALAIADAQPNPDDWKLRVFTERNNPWEQYDNSPTDISPIVNVWFDGSSFDPSSSNVMERQKSEGIFNIDCYGYAESESDGIGHKPGDRESAFELQRCIRLVRNILMSSVYTYLDLRGTVWSRSIRSVKVFQPSIDNRQMQQVTGARISFAVVFNETSPQGDESNTLELVSVDVLRAEDGEILAEADYVYPLT